MRTSLADSVASTSRVRRCRQPNCVKPVHARNLCMRHYSHWMRDSLSRPACAAAGCANMAISRGWCEKHYRRYLHHGDASFVTMPYVRRVDEEGDLVRNVTEIQVVTAETVQFWIEQTQQWKNEWKEIADGEYQACVDQWRDWTTPTQQWEWNASTRRLRPGIVTSGWSPDE